MGGGVIISAVTCDASNGAGSSATVDGAGGTAAVVAVGAGAGADGGDDTVCLRGWFASSETQRTETTSPTSRPTSNPPAASTDAERRYTAQSCKTTLPGPCQRADTRATLTTWLC